MTTSLVDAESVLAVDIGSRTTRAHLFDVVDGVYSFVASGSAPSTVQAPYRDVGEGAHQAILQLQGITGRTLISPEGQIILPSQPSGAGADRLVLTYSSGPTPRIVLAGLLNDVSLASAQRMAGSIFGQVVETLSLNDRRKPDLQIDAIVKARPDLVVIAGGTESGATRSVYKLVDLINLTCRVIPPEQRPEIIYCANQALAKRIKENLEKWTKVNLAPNLRPSIDQEDLGPAQQALMRADARLRVRRMNGLEALAGVASTQPMPSGYAFGRVVHFLSRVLDPAKGVLGVDLGNAATVVASSMADGHAISTFPYGLGRGAANALQQIKTADVMKWLPMLLEEAAVRDYLWQKSLTPDLLPQNEESLAIELAFARELLRLAVQQFQARYAEFDRPLEPIIAGGALFTQIPPAQALLTLIDGIQPLGVTTVILDQNNLAPALGAAADFNPVLPVQVLESGAFLNLGTVISPLSDARYGTSVVKARVEFEHGNETTVEVAKGSIATLPIQAGQAARIYLQARHGAVLDPYSRKTSLNFKVVGGVCGAVIDARGRPLALPVDDSRRRDMIKKWLLNLGG